MDDTEWTALAEALAADVRRVSERLRHLSQAQLAALVSPATGGPPYGSRAEAGRAVAQVLVDTALALDATAAGQAPAPRPLPDLADFAVGDQVAVAGHDVRAAMKRVRPDTRLRMYADAGATSETTAADAVDHAARLLADVRRRL